MSENIIAEIMEKIKELIAKAQSGDLGGVSEIAEKAKELLANLKDIDGLDDIIAKIKEIAEKAKIGDSEAVKSLAENIKGFSFDNIDLSSIAEKAKDVLEDSGLSEIADKAQDAIEGGKEAAGGIIDKIKGIFDK